MVDDHRARCQRLPIENVRARCLGFTTVAKSFRSLSGFDTGGVVVGAGFERYFFDWSESGC